MSKVKEADRKYEYVYEVGESITCDECGEISEDEWRVNYYQTICENCFHNFHPREGRL